MPTNAGTLAISKALLNRLMQGKVVPFLGAGCSIPHPSRMPAASELAEYLIDRGAGVPGDKLEDIAEEQVAQGGWQAFVQLLPIDEWRVREPNVIYRVISELCREGLIHQILTTNWDLLIEGSLSRIGQPYAKVVDATSLAIEPTGSVTLIKLNGCIDHPSLIRATRTDIESVEWLAAWIAAIFDVLIRMNSLLFAGYSGASRAASKTMASITGAGERHAEDFLVDRQTPTELREDPSGAQFVAALNLSEPYTGDAATFFVTLREEMFPLLIGSAKRAAKLMLREVVDPSNVKPGELLEALVETSSALADCGATEAQRWLRSAFASFPECDSSDPYLPWRPHADAIGKALALVTVAVWAGVVRLSLESGRVESFAAGESSAVVPCHFQGCHSHRRRDSVGRTFVADAEEVYATAPASVIVGVIFGGLGDIERTMVPFSVARGRARRDAARGTGLVVAWIDGDSLFSEFRTSADAAEVQDGVKKAFSGAISDALAAAA